MKMILLVISLLGIQAHAAWDLNDVTYLMPLPAVMNDSGLLRVSDAGPKGILINPSYFESMPGLTLSGDRDVVIKSLRVVGVRIDPCFPLPTPQSCQKQIRMVWQPLTHDFDGEVQTTDAGLHSFYVLTDAEFGALTQELATWKKQFNVKTERTPLQVHPAWASEGTQSPSLASFKTIVMKYSGDNNLSRITIMLLRRGGFSWTFMGYSVAEGKLIPLTIPRLNNKEAQSFTNLAQPMDHFSLGRVIPAPVGADILNTLVSDSEGFTTQDEEKILKEVRSAFRIENPNTFNPENMDCVSCHLTTSAVAWVLNKRPHLQAEMVWSNQIYKNPKYDLTNKSVEVWNTQILRSLGYFGKNLAISQRVINESAAVADSLNIQSRGQTRP